MIFYRITESFEFNLSIFFIIIIVGVGASLRVSRLIPRILKVTTM